jgi:hypothetical protein
MVVAQPAVQFVTVQAGHFDVGHQQVDRPGVLRRYFQRVNAIDGLQHATSARLENPPDDRPHHELVVGDQNRQVARFARALQGTGWMPYTQGHVDPTTCLANWPRQIARIAPAQGDSRSG